MLDFDARFGVIPFADADAGIIHSERTVVIDPTGTIRATVEEAGWSNDEIVAAARAAANLSSNPVERLDLWLSEKALALCGNQALGFSGLLDLVVVLVDPVGRELGAVPGRAAHLRARHLIGVASAAGVSVRRGGAPARARRAAACRAR